MSISSLNFVVSNDGHMVSIDPASLKKQVSISTSITEWKNFQDFCTRIFGESNNQYDLVDELDFSQQMLKDEAFVCQITEDFLVDCYTSYKSLASEAEVPTY